jgi:hypothetical protein
MDAHQVHDHWVTSGGTPAAEYGFEGTLGFGVLDPGPNEQTLYSCDASGDHFVSVDPGSAGRRREQLDDSLLLPFALTLQVLRRRLRATWARSRHGLPR